LLLVGVNDDGEVVGCARPSAEPQVWLKDILRSRVTPLPPFQARWLSTNMGGSEGLLAVLVERSSTTPHLLVNLGAIYVRNQGSSDPVPLHDGRTLSELVARGDAENAEASARIEHLIGARAVPGDPFETLGSGERVVLAATGISAGFDRALFTSEGADRVWRTMVESYGEPFSHDAFNEARISPVQWSQHAVWMERVETNGPDAWVARIRAGDDGTLLGSFAWAGREAPWVLTVDEIGERSGRVISAGRSLLADLGGHGDLLIGISLAYRQEDRVIYPAGRRHGGFQCKVRRNMSFADDPQTFANLTAGIKAELGRSGGIGPA
jgi:hypothetical protein